MSIKIMVRAWDTDLPDSQKLVLLALADWANDDGYCWPSIKRLAEKCSKSERTIHNALQALREKGHLTSETVAGKGCHYFVHPITKDDEKNKPDPCNDCTPATTAPLQRLQLTPATVAYNTSIYTKEVNTNVFPSNRARAKKDFVLPDWVPNDAWQGFVEMRSKIKKPMTDYAKRLAVGKLKKLADAGNAVEEVLNQSILHSWQDLYAVKGVNNEQSKNRIDEIKDPMARVIARRQAERAACGADHDEQSSDDWAGDSF